MQVHLNPHKTICRLPGKPPHSFLMAVLTAHRSQLLSPAKVILTGIGVPLTISLFRSPSSPIRVTSEHPGCEGCSYKPQDAHPALRAYSLLPPTFESLHQLKTPLTEELTELLGKILAQSLSILAISTKMMAEKKMGELIRSLFYPLVDRGTVKFLKTLTKELTLRMRYCS